MGLKLTKCNLGTTFTALLVTSWYQAPNQHKVLQILLKLPIIQQWVHRGLFQQIIIYVIRKKGQGARLGCESYFKSQLIRDLMELLARNNILCLGFVSLLLYVYVHQAAVVLFQWYMLVILNSIIVSIRLKWRKIHCFKNKLCIINLKKQLKKAMQKWKGAKKNRKRRREPQKESGCLNQLFVQKKIGVKLKALRIAQLVI